MCRSSKTIACIYKRIHNNCTLFSNLDFEKKKFFQNNSNKLTRIKWPQMVIEFGILKCFAYSCAEYYLLCTVHVLHDDDYDDDDDNNECKDDERTMKKKSQCINANAQF